MTFKKCSALDRSLLNKNPLRSLPLPLHLLCKQFIQPSQQFFPCFRGMGMKRDGEKVEFQTQDPTHYVLTRLPFFNFSFNRFRVFQRAREDTVCCPRSGTCLILMVRPAKESYCVKLQGDELFGSVYERRGIVGQS